LRLSPLSPISTSGAKEDLDCLPGVHGFVAGRRLIKGKFKVEDLAGIDLPVRDASNKNFGIKPAFCDRGLTVSPGELVDQVAMSRA
jgi:hypothetical protein